MTQILEAHDSLLTRLGGKEVLDQIVRSFIANVQTHPQLRHDLDERLILNLCRSWMPFFQTILGDSPERVTNLSEARRLCVTTAEARELLEVLHSALTNVGIDRRLQQELITFLKPFGSYLLEIDSEASDIDLKTDTEKKEDFINLKREKNMENVTNQSNGHENGSTQTTSPSELSSGTAILEALPNPVLCLTKTMQVTYLNKALCEWLCEVESKLSIGLDEIVGSSLESLCSLTPQQKNSLQYPRTYLLRTSSR